MDFQIIIDSLPAMIGGMGLTIQLTGLSLLIGLAGAVPLGLMRVSKNPLLWMPAYGYILFFRGTPLLVQLFLIYYGSGQFRDQLESLGLWVFFREAYFCAILSLSLNTAGYTAEILRGAIRGVPVGEVEAAKACGMRGVLLYRRIILPKAFRLSLQAYSNEVVFLFQATSLVSIITLMDLTGIARVIAARTFDIYEIYITAGLLYLCVTYGILYVFRKVEHRWSAHQRARDSDPVQEATITASMH
ncbi:MAG: ABC transporter permease [Rhodospirillaceae bacterium]|nr:ABC transporter permease [Rhodospirillaceae bacterium]MBL6941414.1 ABC transporter permease [Rhodospirillales bacterium]